MCNNFKGKAQINCGPTVPFNIVEGNAVEVLPCQLKLAHSFVNNFKVSILRDSGSTLFGVKKKRLGPPLRLHTLLAELLEVNKKPMLWDGLCITPLWIPN